MRHTTNIFKSIVVAIAFLATAVSGYAQKEGSENVKENMLRYRYIDRVDRKVTFSTPRTFAERIMIVCNSTSV